MKSIIPLIILLTIFALNSVAYAKDQANEDLPDVLLIGDSISIGYTSFVRKELKGKADVVRNKGNAQHTRTGLEKLDSWLGDTKWEVIHFNWGLWDLCYRNNILTTPLDEYEENLDQLLQRLKKTDAKLIWAHTTYVPQGEPKRKVGDDEKYNEVAEKIMKKHGITINDLHKLTAGFPPDLFIKPGDVHYTKEGSQKLGAQVAKAILAQLED